MESFSQPRVFCYGGGSGDADVGPLIQNLHAAALKQNLAEFSILTSDFSDFQQMYPFLCVSNADAGGAGNESESAVQREYPNSILPNRLYVGGRAHATDTTILRDLGITHIVDLTAKANGTSQKQITEADSERTVTYCNVCTSDMGDFTMMDLFKISSHFVENALQEHENNCVLIHCNQGRSRSATFTIAYLMHGEKVPLAVAYGMVSTARPQAYPNDGLLQELSKYEANLFGNSTVHFISNSVIRDKTGYHLAKLKSWNIEP